jgi:RasGEF N-terminal motif
MYADIFEREYRILLHQIETRDSNLTLYDVKFEAFLNDPSLPKEMVERSMFRINSGDEGVIKYDPELPKTPFNIAGASLDKILERLTDVYGPDQEFITLIIHTHRCFTDSPTLLKKLIARMSPILKQNEGNMSGWKPVIKLRYFLVSYVEQSLLYSSGCVWLGNQIFRMKLQKHSLLISLIPSLLPLVTATNKIKSLIQSMAQNLNKSKHLFKGD